MTFIKFFALLSLIFLFQLNLISCASSPMAPQVKPAKGPLFPNGIHKHEVYIKLNIPEKNIHDSFNFNAAIKKQDQNLSLLAYSHLGVSLFQIEDQTSLPLQWKSDLEVINKNKDFFLKIYPNLKRIFLLSGQELLSDHNTFYWQNPEFKIEFIHFDKNGYPMSMLMSDNLHYSVQIKNLTESSKSK